MTKALKYFTFCLLITVVHGCEEPNKDAPPSVDALLTQNEWKLTEWTSEPAYPVQFGNEVRSYANVMELYQDLNRPCLAEQILSVSQGADQPDNESKRYEYFEGRSGCSASKPLESGAWAIIPNSNGIYIYLTNLLNTTPGTATQLYKVEEISNGRLIISKRYGVTGSSAIYVWKKVFSKND